MIYNIYTIFKKQIASGKGGEGALKPVSGSFICPMETINDSIKAMEETIKNLKLEGLKIGIICNSNEIYNETTGKYEMEGAKANFDCYQMTDYFTKLISDHPSIIYLQDPMADIDLAGWHYLCQQMPTYYEEVKICCSSLFANNIENVKKVMFT